MNSFYEHHKHNIQWHYRCFDRILLNGLIQPFQQPERVIGFFNTYRQLYPVTRHTLRHIAEQFQRWVTERAAKRKIPIIEAPRGRRDEFVDPYFERAKPDQVVVILKAREPARIMIAIGDKAANRWHLQIADRWVTQYNFYINDKVWGRMFVRICPYLPFSARVCLNQHHWLANRMRQQGIAFNQLGNAFLKCTAPDRLQKLANSLAPRDLVTCGQKWLAHLTPFFTANERQHAGCQHRLFFSQVEFCDNLIFRRRAALDKLGERLLDANRTIGQPEQGWRLHPANPDDALSTSTQNDGRRSRERQVVDLIGLAARYGRRVKKRVFAVRPRPIKGLADALGVLRGKQNAHDPPTVFVVLQNLLANKLPFAVAIGRKPNLLRCAKCLADRFELSGFIAAFRRTRIVKSFGPQKNGRPAFPLRHDIFRFDQTQQMAFQSPIGLGQKQKPGLR